MNTPIQARRSWRRLGWVVGLTLAAGLLLSAAAARWQHVHHQRLLAEQTQARGASLAEALVEQVRGYERGLYGLRAATAAMGGIHRMTPQAFEAYHQARELQREFPGVYGFGLVRQVAPSGLAAFVRERRQAGQTGFVLQPVLQPIPQPTPQPTPQPPREATAPHYIVQAQTAVQGGGGFEGRDLASEPQRRQTADRARRAGSTQISPPLPLARADAPARRSFLLMLPLADGGAPGWVFAALLADEWFASVDRVSDEFTLRLQDVDLASGAVTTFFEQPDMPAADRPCPGEAQLSHNLFGRQWRISVCARPAFATALQQPSAAAVGAAGAALSALLAALAGLATRAWEGRRHLQWVQARLAAYVDQAPDPIVATDLDHHILRWNAAAERVFGHSAAQAVGQRLPELLTPPTMYAECAALVQGLARGEAVYRAESQRLRRDGSLVDVSINITPLPRPDGSVHEFVHVLHDIGDTKALRRQEAGFRAALEEQVAQRTAESEAARHDLQTLVDKLPAVIGYFDSALVNRFANLALAQLAHRALASVPGTDMPTLLGRRYWDTSRPQVEAVLAGTAQKYETAYTPPGSAQPRYFLVELAPDERDGQVHGFYAIQQDITELRHDRQRLAEVQRENEALLGTLHQHALVSMMAPDGTVLDANEALCRVCGWPRDELIGHNDRLRNADPQRDEQAFWRWLASTLRAGQVWQGQICNRGKAGTLYWMDTTIAPLVDAEGRIERFIAIGHDVTQHRQALTDLAAERTRLALTLLATGAGSFEFEVVANRLLATPSFAQMLGWPLDEIQHAPGERLLAMVHDDDRPMVAEAFKQHLRGQAEVFRFEARIRHRLGHWVWSLTTAKISQRNDAGQPLMLTGANIDISSIKQAQEALALSERRQRLFADSVAEGIMVSEAGQVIDVSDVWASVFRCRPQDALGKSLLDFTAPAMRAEVQRRMAEGHADFYDSVLLRADGTTFPALVRSQPVQLDGGRQVRLTTVLDVTRQREAEQRLAQARADADAANEAKSRFLANMSHEIRTPLNAVIGLTYLLVDTPLNDAQRALAGKIQIAGRSLLGQVNDVLDLSKIEAGEMTLELAPTDLPALLQEALYLVESEAEAKGLALRSEIPPDLPPQVLADEVRLRQILVNLLGNAVKFTDQGEVLLRAEVLPAADETLLQLHLEVRDTGVGIAPDMVDQLFEPFVQADSTDRRRFAGTGLGLSIVRKLARLMGGDAGVHSQPGRGSNFWVDVQLQRTEAGSVASHAALQVLIAEDDARQRKDLVALARALGWQVTAVGDGRQLVQAALTGAGGAGVPDVVIVDWQMPELDGLSALAELHQSLGGEHVPAAVVVSASQAAQVLGAEHAALADTVLTKPISASALFNAVNTAVSRRSGSWELLRRSTRIDKVASLWLHGVQVLVVDDNDTNLMVASHILRRQGATVSTAADGRQALQRLAQAHFDAVLMDVQMPVMDGIEATRQWRALERANPAGTRLPVIALTAGALAAERQRVLDAGMDDFLAKPFEPHTLVRLLRRHIERARGSLLLVRPVNAPPAVGVALTPPAPAGAASVVLAGDPAWPDIAGIVAQEVRSRLDGDLGLFRQLLRRLLIDYRDLAPPDGDAPAAPALLPPRAQLSARMHKLRGAAGALSAVAVFEAAGQAEAALQASASEPALRAALAALGQALASLDRHAGAWLVQSAADSAAKNAADSEAASPAGGPGAQPAAASAAAPITAEALAQLIGLLKLQDLSALDSLAHNDSGLRASLGAEQHARLRDSIETLDFEAAARLLSEAARTAPG